MRRPSLSVPERHQLKIARDTLKMSDAGALVPNKAEALCDVFGCASAWTCDRPGKQGFRHCVCDKHAGIDKEDFLHSLFNGRILVRLRKAALRET